MSNADLKPIDAAKRTVAMLTKDIEQQEKMVGWRQQVLDELKADLEIAKRELAELEMKADGLPDMRKLERAPEPATEEGRVPKM